MSGRGPACRIAGRGCRGAATALLSLLVGGCAAPPVVGTYTALRAYWPAELQVGDPARDFAFTGANGAVTRLSAVRGRVTILVFPADESWPDAAQHGALADLACGASKWSVPVRVVSVGRPSATCPDALARLAGWGGAGARVALVCDPHARVHQLFGADAVGHWYVLTNFLRIAARGVEHDLAGLDAAVREVVDTIYDQDLREGAYDWYRWP